eukprot:superscaffoldBa00002537_g14578
MIRWPDGEGQVGNFARMLGSPPLFVMSAMGSLMTTVSQDLRLTSHLKDSISYSSVPITALGCTGPPTPLPAAT